MLLQDEWGHQQNCCISSSIYQALGSRYFKLVQIQHPVNLAESSLAEPSCLAVFKKYLVYGCVIHHARGRGLGLIQKRAEERAAKEARGRNAPRSYAKNFVLRNPVLGQSILRPSCMLVYLIHTSDF